ncbi:MAG TPA: cysteine--tRNA ligase [Actinomycetota bacterium]|jgi:cysteinyl-tRNA synthetase|nr:cysteine--tRNA ligase [Actinomycetota bacterium]
MRLFDSLSRAVQEVEPVEPGRVKIYTCGPTVYRYVHLGNLRTFLLGDLIRRAFEFEGYQVTQVLNITDVGHMTDESSPEAVDKMLLAVEDEGLQPLEIAEKYTEEALSDMALIGIRMPDVMPRATEHIPEMIQLTEKLIDRDHAYVVDSGSVYYDVTSFPSYGKLSGNTLDNLKAGHRDLETDPTKRHPADFALWKSAGPGRLMKWPSPWGEGFPGWHIECSAMSMKYLGDRFDLHTGGNDLKFPHHEDEIAQSEGAVGHQVVSTWVHGGFLRLTGQKIAKSTGNVIRAPELVERELDPLAFRWLTFQTRYRSEMDFTWEAMETADQRVKQLRRHVAEWGEAAGELRDVARDFDRRFRDAVGSDLDMPAAVRVVNDLDRAADVPPGEKRALLASWDHVLGLDVEREANAGWEPSDEVRRLVAHRDAARGRKDYASSDRLRDELQAMGLEVMDTADGTKVRPRT